MPEIPVAGASQPARMAEYLSGITPALQAEQKNLCESRSLDTMRPELQKPAYPAFAMAV
jgi:hypothetical protein